jgi:hypothetical protein
MPDGLREFLTNVRAAKEQDTAERQAHLRWLKTLTAEQFVRLSRDVVAGLSTEEYAQVVAHIAPDHVLPEPKVDPSADRRRWSLLTPWKKMPTAVRAVIAGLVVGLIMLGAALGVGPALDWWASSTPPVRPTDVTLWPVCPRLDDRVDGCVYKPATNLAWATAAELVRLAEQDLRQLNRHIAANYIPAGATVVVWRSRGKLQGGAP